MSIMCKTPQLGENRDIVQRNLEFFVLRFLDLIRKPHPFSFKLQSLADANIIHTIRKLIRSLSYDISQ